MQIDHNNPTPALVELGTASTATQGPGGPVPEYSTWDFFGISDD